MSTTSEQILAKVEEYNQQKYTEYHKRRTATPEFKRYAEKEFELFVEQNCTTDIIERSGQIEKHGYKGKDTITLFTPFGKLIKESHRNIWYSCDTYKGFVDYKYTNGLIEKLFVSIEHCLSGTNPDQVSGFIRDTGGNIIHIKNHEPVPNTFEEILPQTIEYFEKSREEIESFEITTL